MSNENELNCAHNRVNAYKGCGHPLVPTAVWLLAEVERLTKENERLRRERDRPCLTLEIQKGGE